jgi:hypothetical protein
LTTKDLSESELESLYTLWDGETRELILLCYSEALSLWIKQGTIKVRKKVDTQTEESEGERGEEGQVSVCGDGLGFSLGEMEEYLYTRD